MILLAKSRTTTANHLNLLRVPIRKARPHAAQVADRWHLSKNASHAFLDAVRKSMRQIGTALSAAAVDTAPLTAAERIQHEG